MGELTVDRRQPLPHTKDKKKLLVKPIPLRLLVGLGDTERMDAGTVAEIIASCVVFEDGSPAFTVDEVMESDGDLMVELFTAVQNTMPGEDAEKN